MTETVHIVIKIIKSVFRQKKHLEYVTLRLVNYSKIADTITLVTMTHTFYFIA